MCTGVQSFTSSRWSWTDLRIAWVLCYMKEISQGFMECWGMCNNRKTVGHWSLCWSETYSRHDFEKPQSLLTLIEKATREVSVKRTRGQSICRSIHNFIFLCCIFLKFLSKMSWQYKIRFVFDSLVFIGAQQKSLSLSSNWHKVTGKFSWLQVSPGACS